MNGNKNLLFGLNLRLGIRLAMWLRLGLSLGLKPEIVEIGGIYDFVAVVTSDDQAEVISGLCWVTPLAVCLGNFCLLQLF